MRSIWLVPLTALVAAGVVLALPSMDERYRVVTKEDRAEYSSRAVKEGMSPRLERSAAVGRLVRAGSHQAAEPQCRLRFTLPTFLSDRGLVGVVLASSADSHVTYPVNAGNVCEIPLGEAASQGLHLQRLIWHDGTSTGTMDLPLRTSVDCTDVDLSQRLCSVLVTDISRIPLHRIYLIPCPYAQCLEGVPSYPGVGDLARAEVLLSSNGLFVFDRTVAASWFVFADGYALARVPDAGECEIQLRQAGSLAVRLGSAARKYDNVVFLGERSGGSRFGSWVEDVRQSEVHFQSLAVGEYTVEHWNIDLAGLKRCIAREDVTIHPLQATNIVLGDGEGALESVAVRGSLVVPREWNCEDVELVMSRANSAFMNEVGRVKVTLPKDGERADFKFEDAPSGEYQIACCPCGVATSVTVGRETEAIEFRIPHPAIVRVRLSRYNDVVRGAPSISWCRVDGEIWGPSGGSVGYDVESAQSELLVPPGELQIWSEQAGVASRMHLLRAQSGVTYDLLIDRTRGCSCVLTVDAMAGASAMTDFGVRLEPLEPGAGHAVEGLLVRGEVIWEDLWPGRYRVVVHNSAFQLVAPMEVQLFGGRRSVFALALSETRR